MQPTSDVYHDKSGHKGNQAGRLFYQKKRNTTMEKHKGEEKKKEEQKEGRKRNAERLRTRI